MDSSTMSDSASASGIEVTQVEKVGLGSASKFVSRYLEPAIILASLTAGVFLIGQLYVGSYLTELGIPLNLVDMSPDYYLTRAVVPLLIIAGTFFASLMGILNSKQSRSSLILTNFPLLAISVAGFSMSPKTGTSTYANILVGLIFLGLYIAGVLMNKSIWTLMTQGRLINRAFFIAVIVIGTLGISGSMGQLEAMSTLEGMNTSKIEIKLKSNPPPVGIEGKELILLFHKDGKYFVTRAQTIPPEDPEIYIIPDDQVEFATVKRAK